MVRLVRIATWSCTVGRWQPAHRMINDSSTSFKTASQALRQNGRRSWTALMSANGSILLMLSSSSTSTILIWPLMAWGFKAWRRSIQRVCPTMARSSCSSSAAFDRKGDNSHVCLRTPYYEKARGKCYQKLLGYGNIGGNDRDSYQKWKNGRRNHKHQTWRTS